LLPELVNCSASNVEAIAAFDNEQIPSTPPKLKQRTLLESFNQLSCEKQKKPTHDVQELSHKKLSKKLPESSMLVLREKIKELQELSEMEQAIKRKQREVRQAQAGSSLKSSSTQVVDPRLRGRGVSRGLKPSGRPEVSMRSSKSSKSHRRDFAGPVLRRDPTAREKLAMIMHCERAVAHHRLEGIKFLPSSVRKEFEKLYQYDFARVVKWAEKKDCLLHFVGASRVGKHGLRPCGLRGRNVFAKKGKGARIPSREFGEVCIAQPLAAVYKKLKEWLCHERERESTGTRSASRY